MTEKNSVRVPSILRRYTNLAATTHLLKKKKITLLNPSTWDDKVDVAYMRQCSKVLGCQVLALCFCQDRQQRYHHWRVYANGIGGVCVEFDKDWLLGDLDANYDGLLHGDVVYRTHADASKNPPDVLELPFIKRRAYKDEHEYRIVRMFDEDEKSVSVKDYDINLNCIRRVLLSPWMPKDLYMSVEGVLKSIDGCGRLTVIRSSLIEDREWKRFGEDACSEQEKYSKMPDWMASYIE